MLVRYRERTKLDPDLAVGAPRSEARDLVDEHQQCVVDIHCGEGVRVRGWAVSGSYVGEGLRIERRRWGGARREPGDDGDSQCEEVHVLYGCVQ